MSYRISTRYKKSVVETEIWKNDANETLKHTILWRWGSWISEDEPDLSKYDEETGIDPYSLSDNVDLESTDDGDDDWEYPSSWDEKKIEEFHEAWDELWHDAPDTFGFREEDTEFWITGPLDIEEIDNDEN
jgi:hypothetical protein